MPHNPFFERAPRRTPHAAPQIVFFCICLVLLGIIALLWRAPLNGFLWHTLSPVARARAALWQETLGVFASKAALEEKNELLEERVAALEVLNADRSALADENNELKVQLGRPSSSAASQTGGTGEKEIAAGVLAAPPRMPYDMLAIDAGSAQGVSKGDLVSAGGGTLIGTVASVEKSSAQVVLFSESGQTHQGMLSGTSTTPVSVVGEGEGTLSAQVPADTQVAVGDSVLFPGIAAHVSAVVVSIDAPADNSFKTLYLRLPVNVSQLHLVFVIEESGALLESALKKTSYESSATTTQTQ